MISSFGNWGYTYRMHRRFSERSQKSANDLLNERYAKGEVSRDEFHKMKDEINSNFRDAQKFVPQTKMIPAISPA